MAISTQVVQILVDRVLEQLNQPYLSVDVVTDREEHSTYLAQIVEIVAGLDDVIQELRADNKSLRAELHELRTKLNGAPS